MSVLWGLLKVKILSLIESFIHIDINTFGKTEEESEREYFLCNALLNSSKGTGQEGRRPHFPAGVCGHQASVSISVTGEGCETSLPGPSSSACGLSGMLNTKRSWHRRGFVHSIKHEAF